MISRWKFTFFFFWIVVLWYFVLFFFHKFIQFSFCNFSFLVCGWRKIYLIFCIVNFPYRLRNICSGNDVNNNYVIKARENNVVYIRKLSLIYNFWSQGVQLLIESNIYRYNLFHRLLKTIRHTNLLNERKIYYFFNHEKESRIK